MEQERLIARNVLNMQEYFDKQVIINDKTIDVFKGMHEYLNALDDRLTALEIEHGIDQPGLRANRKAT